jgi:hypothetical protein
MRNALRRVGVIAAVVLCVAAQAQQPINDGDTLTGTLRVVHTTHPNGTRIKAYQLVSEPRMMPADDEFCAPGKAVTIFHLFTLTEADERQLMPLVGRRVSVQAVELFCAQTAWHIGDVAVPEWKLLPAD